MLISRMDFVDAGSPEALVKHILRAEPNLQVPVPIQVLCVRLGILEIEDLDTDGFEGSVVTDAKRSEGTILAKRGGEPRRRFTIAPELSHFLMAHHVPDQPGRFLCKSSDLLRLTAKEGDQRQRREVEATRRRGGGCRLSSSYAAASRRLPLRAPGDDPTPDPLVAASLPPATRHQPVAGGRLRQA